MLNLFQHLSGQALKHVGICMRDAEINSARRFVPQKSPNIYAGAYILFPLQGVRVLNSACKVRSNKIRGFVR